MRVFAFIQTPFCRWGYGIAVPPTLSAKFERSSLAVYRPTKPHEQSLCRAVAKYFNVKHLLKWSKHCPPCRHCSVRQIRPPRRKLTILACSSSRGVMSLEVIRQVRAEAFLTKFQQTPVAWEVSDKLLSAADVPMMEYRFFGAQTMRTKVQFDFYELPVESYGALRDSMLNHIDRFRAAEHQPIHTQLAIALADLAIQMDNAWS
eukprot:s127_g17.t1